MHPRAIAKAPASSQTTGFGLPPELLAESVERLGWVALTYAACFVVMDAAYRVSAQSQGIDQSLFDQLLVSAIILGIGMFALTRRRGMAAHSVLVAGLVFEVVSSFIIALGEHEIPYEPGSKIRGFSALAAWIPTFSLLVPAGRVPSAMAALTSAAMGPLALGVQVWLRGVTPPASRDLPVLLVPPFLMAIAAMMLSRTIYRLGARVTQEREMGSYRLVERIGAGGMGEVWRAEHRLLAREAAIKLIAPAKGSEGSVVVRQRFEREARAIAALQSPHTVTLFDYGVTDQGQLYYVMELLQGFDLEELVTKFGPLPAARAAYLLAQMCASLEEAHAAGLTHRDIKPRNVFVGRLGAECDFAKVLDFGLVKSAGREEELQLTNPTATTGTPAYLAPEMAMGGAVDARADLYSLGCTGYWLLTGQLVFPSKTATAMLMDHVRSTPEPPSARAEVAVPAAFDELILQCLAKEPADRPRSAGELRRRLEAWSAGWTREDAARWWETHRPDSVAAGAK